MDRLDIRRWALRDWDRIAAAKRERTVAAHVERGSSHSAALAADLYQHVKARRPDWPSAADRDDDLAAHVTLQALLARISRDRGA